MKTMDKKTREVTRTESLAKTNEVLRKQVAELQDQLAKAKLDCQSSSLVMETAVGPATKMTTPDRVDNSRPNTTSQRKYFACWGCGDPEHVIRHCPNRTPEKKNRIRNRNASKQVRPIQGKQTGTSIIVRYRNRRINALIDTGSDITVAGTDVAKRHHWKVRPCELTSVTVANGEPIMIAGIVKQYLSVGSNSKMFEMYISPDITGFIIGIDWLKQQGKFVWDFRQQRIQFDNDEWIELQKETEQGCRRIYVEQDVILPARQETLVPVRISHRSRMDIPFVGVMENRKIPNLGHVYSGRSIIPAKFTELKVCVINTENRTQTLKKGTNLGTVEKAEIIEQRHSTESSDHIKAEEDSTERSDVICQMMDKLPGELTESQRSNVQHLLQKNEAIFSTGNYDIGRTSLVEHRIDTGNHRPVRQPLHRQPFEHLKVIDQQVDEMKKHGIIEQAASPWAANIVLVRKKDGALRFCVDYRRLNTITYKDSYPLPLIDNCLNALAGSSWFSVLDLRAGYHNIPIAKEDRDKTAFVTRSGCYRFTVMPFGLTCAPSVFQRLMDFELCGLSYITCLVYLDDIIIFGRTFEEQLIRLSEVFDRIKTANLKLKPSKCSLFQRQVSFIGHVISEAGIAMQTEKIQAVRDWHVCRNLTELRAFMGTCGYYRRFVKDFSSIAAPLYGLMKKGVRFEWNTECQQAFAELKKRLTTEPVLALPTDNGMYILDTDASDFGLGAVLPQQQNGEERVIAYTSRTMNRSELKYETTRKELLAVVNGLKQFRQYLLGRHFVIRTDHVALSWLRRTPEPMPQLARWLTLIEQYDYEVLHRIGKRHCNADGLSRIPEVAESDTDDSPKVNIVSRSVTVDSPEGMEPPLVRESLLEQRTDPEEQCCTFHRGKLSRQGPLRPVLAEAPKSWITESNSVEQQVSTTEEIVKMTASPNGPNAAYSVDEAPLRTRPRRTICPPKHLEKFVCPTYRIGIIRLGPLMKISHQ